MTEPDWAPLTGFRVAVTSARRAEELATLLTRRDRREESPFGRLTARSA